jgi:thiamine pyrophosphate-dependent acetolactate synthase large subunit-like protein
VEWGVSVVFGLPGDKISRIMNALRRQQDKIRFVLVRHEEGAAFMASGYGLRVAVDVPIVGDVRRALTDLLPLLESQADRTFFEQIQAKTSEWNQALHRIETSTKMPLQPQVVARQVSELLAPDALIAFDCGSNTFFAARHIGQRSTNCHIWVGVCYEIHTNPLLLLRGYGKQLVWRIVARNPRYLCLGTNKCSSLSRSANDCDPSSRSAFANS